MDLSLDLSPWRYPEDFQLHVAACLVAGKRPLAQRRYPHPNDLPPEACPYLEMMVQAYVKGEAVRAGFVDFTGDERLLLVGVPPERAAFLGMLQTLKPPDELRRLFSVVVSRNEIRRWLSATGIKSKFDFSGRNVSVNAANAGALDPATDVASLPARGPHWVASEQSRRLKLLYELGGRVEKRNGEWTFLGIGSLIQREKNVDQQRTDAKTIRADLRAAFEAELEERRTGGPSPFPL